MINTQKTPKEIRFELSQIATKYKVTVTPCKSDSFFIVRIPESIQSFFYVELHRELEKTLPLKNYVVKIDDQRFPECNRSL